MANIKDDVTLNGKIVDILEGYFLVQLKSGQTIWTSKENFNTVRPYIPEPEKDERRGN